MPCWLLLNLLRLFLLSRRKAEGHQSYTKVRADDWGSMIAGTAESFADAGNDPTLLSESKAVDVH